MAQTALMDKDGWMNSGDIGDMFGIRRALERAKPSPMPLLKDLWISEIQTQFNRQALFTDFEPKARQHLPCSYGILSRLHRYGKIERYSPICYCCDGELEYALDDEGMRTPSDLINCGECTHGYRPSHTTRKCKCCGHTQSFVQSR